MELGVFEASTKDELLGPLRLVWQMVIQYDEFTEKEFFIREERGKGKNKVGRVYAHDKLKKHIEMEHLMVDR